MSNVRDAAMNYGKLYDNYSSDLGSIIYQKKNDSISINITNKCPNQCPFCIRDIRRGWSEKESLYLQREPTINDIKIAFDNYIRDSDVVLSDIRFVNMCGYGEPLMRFDDLPEITSVLRGIVGENATFMLTTSGWPYKLLGSNRYDLLKKLLSNGLGVVKVSIHSSSNEQFLKRFRPIIEGVSFDDTINFIKVCQDIGFEVIGCFFDSMNSEYEIRSLCSELGIKSDIKLLDRENHRL